MKKTKKCPICKEKVSVDYKKNEVLCNSCKTVTPIITQDLFISILDEFTLNKNNIVPKHYFVPFGTDEWVDYTANSHYFCPYLCLYCYGRTITTKFGKQWGFSEGELEEWKFQRKPNWKTHFPKNKKILVMYPSIHDLIAKKKEEHLAFIRDHLLVYPNVSLLLVSKGDISVVSYLGKKLESEKDRIEWRITVTSNKEDILATYEPKAPSYYERIQSLDLLKEMGYKTSISVEPLLILKKISESKCENLQNHVNELKQHCNGEIWIGLMNHIPQIKARENLNPDIEQLMEDIFTYYQHEWIDEFVFANYKDSQIRFKESIKKYIFKKIEKMEKRR